MTLTTLRGVANGWLARLWPFTHFGGLAIIWRKVWVNTVVFARGFQKKKKNAKALPYVCHILNCEVKHCWAQLVLQRGTMRKSWVS